MYLYLQVFMVLGIFLVILITFIVKINLIVTALHKYNSDEDESPLKFINVSYSILMLSQQLAVTLFLWINLFTIKKFADEAIKDALENASKIAAKAVKKERAISENKEQLIEDTPYELAKSVNINSSSRFGDEVNDD